LSHFSQLEPSWLNKRWSVKFDEAVLWIGEAKVQAEDDKAVINNIVFEKRSVAQVGLNSLKGEANAGQLRPPFPRFALQRDKFPPL